MSGKTFRQIRLSQNKTQAEFGEMLGMGQSTIANIEAGRNVITHRTLARLAQLPDVDGLSDFLQRFKEIEHIFSSIEYHVNCKPSSEVSNYAK